LCSISQRNKPAIRRWNLRDSGGTAQTGSVLSSKPLGGMWERGCATVMNGGAPEAVRRLHSGMHQEDATKFIVGCLDHLLTTLAAHPVVFNRPRPEIRAAYEYCSLPQVAERCCACGIRTFCQPQTADCRFAYIVRGLLHDNLPWYSCSFNCVPRLTRFGASANLFCGKSIFHYSCCETAKHPSTHGVLLARDADAPSLR
jgi:hypothetical protein